MGRNDLAHPFHQLLIVFVNLVVLFNLHFCLLGMSVKDMPSQLVLVRVLNVLVNR